MARLIPHSAVTAGNESSSIERSQAGPQAAADAAEADAVRHYAARRPSAM